MTAQSKVKPSLAQIKRGTYIWKDRQYHKLCTGPAHEEPEYLPATEKYFYFHQKGQYKGQPVARCRLCNNWTKLKFPGASYQGRGRIPALSVRPYITEAVNRIGVAELSRRSGVSQATITRALTDDEHQLLKVIVRKLLLELTSLQRKNEYSISVHSRWRQEIRNSNGRARCSNCGVLATRYSKDCQTCYDRFHRRYRDGKLTDKEWKQIKDELSDRI